MIGRRTDATEEGLLALQARYDQIVAERQSLYNLVDKLTGYCEGLERRIDSLVTGLEAAEDRITTLEVGFDGLQELTNDHAQALTDYDKAYDEYLSIINKKEVIDETG